MGVLLDEEDLGLDVDQGDLGLGQVELDVNTAAFDGLGGEIGGEQRVDRGQHLDSGLGDSDVDGHGGGNLGDGQRAQFQLDVSVARIPEDGADVHLVLQAQSDGGGAVDGQTQGETGDDGEGEGRVQEHHGAGDVNVDLLSSLDEVLESIVESRLNALGESIFTLVAAIVVHSSFSTEDVQEGIDLDVFLIIHVDTLLKCDNIVGRGGRTPFDGVVVNFFNIVAAFFLSRIFILN